MKSLLYLIASTWLVMLFNALVIEWRSRAKLSGALSMVIFIAILLIIKNSYLFSFLYFFGLFSAVVLYRKTRGGSEKTEVETILFAVSIYAYIFFVVVDWA